MKKNKNNVLYIALPRNWYSQNVTLSAWSNHIYRSSYDIWSYQIILQNSFFMYSLYNVCYYNLLSFFHFCKYYFDMIPVVPQTWLIVKSVNYTSYQSGAYNTANMEIVLPLDINNLTYFLDCYQD